MTYVVTEPCIRCKYTDCVEVCPMQCFREVDGMLVIDPDGCIECAMCEPECPVDAILHVTALPPDQQSFIDVNARLARSPASAPITARKPPPADHAQWARVEGKRRLLEAAGAYCPGEPIDAALDGSDLPPFTPTTAST